MMDWCSCFAELMFWMQCSVALMRVTVKIISHVLEALLILWFTHMVDANEVPFSGNVIMQRWRELEVSAEIGSLRVSRGDVFLINRASGRNACLARFIAAHFANITVRRSFDHNTDTIREHCFPKCKVCDVGTSTAATPSGLQNGPLRVFRDLFI